MYLYPWSPYSRYWKYSISSDYCSSKAIEKEEWYLFDNEDIYIMMVSYVHCISKKDTYVAIISTTAETNEPEKEI